MPTDMRPHGTGGQAEALGDLSRFYAGQPQDVELVFELWFHFVPPNKERMAVMTILSA